MVKKYLISYRFSFLDLFFFPRFFDNSVRAFFILFGFGAETWVVTPRMGRALSGFLHGAARRLTGRQARRGRNGAWHYLSLEGAMREAGLTEIRKSIANRQNTVAQYIATRPLLDLYEGPERGRARGCQ